MDRRATLGLLAAAEISASIVAGCGPKAIRPVFKGENPVFSGEPQKLETYAFTKGDLTPREPGVFVKPILSKRTKQRFMRLEIVYPGAIPEADGQEVYVCIQDSRGWKVSPMRIPQRSGYQYDKECAKAEKPAAVTGTNNEKLGRYAATFQVWEKRMGNFLKGLRIGLMAQGRQLRYYETGPLKS